MHAKWIYLAQRNARLSREAFLARWLAHRRIGTRPEMIAEFVAGFYGHVRSDGLGLDMISDEYDALGLFTLNGLYSIPVINRVIRMDYIQADEKRFFTTTSDQFSIFCAEDVVKEGEESGALMMQFVRRKADVAPRDFAARWRAEEAKAVLEQASFKGSIARYVQNMVIAPQPAGYGYDAAAELWFDSPEAMRAAAAEIHEMMTNSPLIEANNSLCIMTDIVMRRPRAS
jgi:hypothetical protein